MEFMERTTDPLTTNMVSLQVEVSMLKNW